MSKATTSLEIMLQTMEQAVPGCNTSGIERIPDALIRRFKEPNISLIDFADA